jgi:N utilization substance protein A
LILDVRESPRQVKIVLSRSHPDFIRRLFELEVPEVSERIIEIKALAREAGYRTKIAVSSIDAKVDAVGACVGVRGSRIRNIVVELGGEKIDIVRWNESSQILIGNALKPAEVAETALCFELGRATVVVPEDQLSLAIGKRGQNVRLAARLTGWDIDILTPTEYNKGLDDMDRVLSSVEGVDSDSVAKMSAMGMISLSDLEEVGIDPLVSDVGLDEAVAQRVLEVAGEEVRRQAEEKERIEKETAAQAEAAGPAVAEGESAPAAEASASATEEEGVTGGIEALLQKPAAESEEGVPAVEAESSEIGEMTAPTETPDESDAAPDAETEMREVVAESLSAMTEAAGPVEGEIAPEEEIAAEAQDKATEPGIAEGAEAEAPAPPGEPTSEEEPAATSSAEEEQREGGA